MWKKSGDDGGIVYKDGKACINGKLIWIGFKDGEHIPRASDYKRPKQLIKAAKAKIETSRAVNESLYKAYLNEQKAKT